MAGLVRAGAVLERCGTQGDAVERCGAAFEMERKSNADDVPPVTTLFGVESRTY